MTTSPVARLFDRVSRVYDTPALQALVYRPAQDLALRRLRDARVERVLDVGCGTGQFATRLRGELEAEIVCGCDFSAGMLEKAITRSREVEWIRGDATKLPLHDGSVDAVVCTEAFHFFDQPAALRECHRALAPGGLLLIAMINPRTEIGSRMLRDQAWVLGVGNWPTQRRMRSLIEGAGFEVEDQCRVNRIFGRLIPTVLSVGVRLR